MPSVFFGILRKCAWTSVWKTCLPADLGSLSQALAGTGWEIPPLPPCYRLHGCENKRQLHYRPVCSLHLFTVTEETPAPKCVIYYNHSTELERFQGKPVSSEIGKDIISKKKKKWLLFSSVRAPFFPIFSFIYPRSHQMPKCQVLRCVAGPSERGDLSPHEAYSLNGRDR